MAPCRPIESAIRRLSADEMRAVRDWLENLLDDQLALTPGFESKIARSEREMAAGLKPRTRQP